MIIGINKWCRRRIPRMRSWYPCEHLFCYLHCHRGQIELMTSPHPRWAVLPFLYSSLSLFSFLCFDPHLNWIPTRSCCYANVNLRDWSQGRSHLVLFCSVAAQIIFRSNFFWPHKYQKKTKREREGERQRYRQRTQMRFEHARIELTTITKWH